MDEGHSRFDPMRLWREYGARLMRYGGVTIVSTVVGLATLFVGLEFFEWDRVLANLASVVVSTPFAYYLNRSYVWEREAGNHSATGEVGPFWIITLIGWAFSTLVVWLAGFLSEASLFLVGAQVAAFGSLWLVKFAFLEKFLWPEETEAASERV